MTWYLWLALGVVIGALSCAVLALLAALQEDPLAVQRTVLDRHRAGAEQQMQTLMQDTVAQMFAAAREPRR